MHIVIIHIAQSVLGYSFITYKSSMAVNLTIDYAKVMGPLKIKKNTLKTLLTTGAFQNSYCSDLVLYLSLIHI